MSQLKTLTLHSASPISPPLPLNVDRMATLPSLTHLDISASVGDCALALAHLDLPILTWLCITAILHHDPNSSNVQGVLPYVVRHAHGPQDIQPLQSILIRTRSDYRRHLDILAWPVPEIDIELHDPPTLLGVALPTRVALSFTSMDWRGHDTYVEILNAVMTALPLDGLVTLTVRKMDDHLYTQDLSQDLSNPQFWLRNSSKWPLLKRVRLTPFVDQEFVKMLLEDNGGRESPLLPSLTELVLVNGNLNAQWTHCLCDALMKRVELGVPLEMLDLRMCDPHYDPAELRSLSEIVADILDPVYIYGPVSELDARGQAMLRTMGLWDDLSYGPFPFLELDKRDDEESEDED